MKDDKVYTVGTGMVEKDNDGKLTDQPNITSYNVIAKDAEDAIRVVRKKFRIRKNEYIEDVVLKTTLD